MIWRYRFVGSSGLPLPTKDLIINTINKMKEKNYRITQAQIKDDFCNYSYEVTDNVGFGDVHAVKGKGIIDNDMREVFTKMNVHLAAIDDVFKHANITIRGIGKMANHELTGLYSVDEFKLKGNEDNRSIILKGTKYIGTGGHITLETPKILLDKHSGYKYWDDLKSVIDDACEEVAAYKEGKYTEQEEPEDPKQLKLTDELDQLDKESGVTIDIKKGKRS